MIEDDASRGVFRSLRVRAFRTWALGAFVSNVGTWMQRTAQDWLVLVELTRHDATAVGTVMALQFGPQVALLPWTGAAADRFDRRKLLVATQAISGALALGLGAATLLGVARLVHVYVFALLLGITTAFDAPARQAFVTDLVSERELSNAVALNSTSFNAARLLGPAAAGLLVAAIGSGWVFVVNGLSFGAVLLALAALRPSDLRRAPRAPSRGRLGDGVRYVARRGDLRTLLAMLFVIGTFGLNFPIFIATMSVRVFGKGAGELGLATSMMAVGSVAGTLLSARQRSPAPRRVLVAAGAFGAGCALAAIAPSYALFGLALVVVGASAQTFTTTVNGAVQLATEPEMRGRVLAILLAVALGGTPLGAPIVGWIADRFGPRWALGVGVIAGLGAAIVGLCGHLGASKEVVSKGD